MQFICETCRANLQIADEKLRGKRLIVRCKRCGVQIRIADPALAAAAQPSMGSDQAAPRATPPPPPLQAFEGDPAVWFAVVRGAQSGPLTRSEIESRVAAGEVHPATYVWKLGTDAWVRAHTDRELAALFPVPPPPPLDEAVPPVAPSTPAAGSIPPLAASAASQPGAPAAPDPLRTPVPGISSGEGALDLARWGADELSRPRAPTPIPATTAEKQSTPSVSKPEFRVAQKPRRGPLRAALILLVVAGVVSLAAFAIFYQRRDGARLAQEAAQSGSPPPGATDSPKVAEQNVAPAAAADPAARATVPSPEVLKKKVDESMPALQGCVDQALQRDPAMRVGKILILTTVAPSGEVTSTRIDKKNVDQSQLGACLKTAARNIHFPSFTGEAFPLDIPIVVAGGD